MNIFLFITICALVALLPLAASAAIFWVALEDGRRFVRGALAGALRGEGSQPCIRPRHA